MLLVCNRYPGTRSVKESGAARAGCVFVCDRGHAAAEKPRGGLANCVRVHVSHVVVIHPNNVMQTFSPARLKK